MMTKSHSIGFPFSDFVSGYGASGAGTIGDTACLDDCMIFGDVECVWSLIGVGCGFVSFCFEIMTGSRGVSISSWIISGAGLVGGTETEGCGVFCSFFSLLALFSTFFSLLPPFFPALFSQGFLVGLLCLRCGVHTGCGQYEEHKPASD